MRVVLAMRRCGEIPYGRIVDRARPKHKRPGWVGVEDMMKAARTQYHRDMWLGQPTVAMVACEKAALEGICTEIVDEHGASFWDLRGGTSETFLFDWAEDIRECNDRGQAVSIAYLGDHDPKGMDIERHTQKALRGFGARFSWVRLGLTTSDLDDVPNLPTKELDTCAPKYRALYGDRGAEVDALPPIELQGRIRGFIESCIDADLLAQTQRVEAAERESLDLVAGNWRLALAAVQEGATP